MQPTSKREVLRTLIRAGRRDLAEKYVRRTVVAGVDMNYITRNLKLLSEYDLRDLDRTIKIADLKRQLDVFVGTDGKVAKTSLRLNFDKSIDELVQQVRDEIGQKFGDIDFEAYKHFGSLVTDYYLRHDKGNTYRLPQDYSLSYLLTFIIYIVTGKIEKDLGRAHRDMDANGWKGMGFEKQFDIEYMGVRIKKFKNKRLDMKFPKPAQAKKAQKLIKDFEEAGRRSRERMW